MRSLVLCLCASAALAQGGAGGAPAKTAPAGDGPGPIAVDAERRAALASIAAAEKSLRLNQAMEVRTWLDAVAPAERAWEWRFLDAVSDSSSRVIHREAPPSRLTVADDQLALVEGSAVHLFSLPSMQLHRTIEGHAAPVYRAEFSPDGSRLVTVSRDVTSRTWDVATGQEIARMSLDNPAVAAAAFSPDGASVATCAWNRDDSGAVHGIVWIWNAATGEVEHKTRVGDKPLSSIEWADGRIVVGSWDGLVHVLDEQGAEIAVLTLPDEGVYRAVNDIDVHGSLVAAASKDQTVRVFNLESHELVATLRGALADVESVCFSAAGDAIIAGGADALIRTWRTSDWTAMDVYRGHVDVVRGVAWIGDDAVSCSYDGTVRFWEAGAQHAGQLSISTGEDGTYTSLFSADGSFVAVACFSGVVLLMDAHSGAEIFRWAAHESSVNTLAMNADSSRLLTCSWDGTAKVVDVASRQVVRTLDAGAGVYHCDISPDGERAALAVGSAVQVWDLERGERLQEWTLDARVSEVRFSRDGRWLGAAAGAATHVWEVDGLSPRTVVHIEGGFSTLDFGDGVLFTGSAGDGVRAWSLDGDCLWRHADRGENAVRLRVQGDRIAVGGNGLTVIDAKTGHVVLRREPLADTIWHVDWRDGRLAACCWNGEIAILTD